MVRQGAGAHRGNTEEDDEGRHRRAGARDKGGGRTHEQHKRNYQALLAAGTLFRLTGDRAYVDYARDMLLQYAQLYPTLGPHPEGRSQIPGRVFWQVLNDSVWLVNAIQGYDAIRDALSAEDRNTIESKVFRPMAEFLVSEPKNYDQIHNHATWAVAATGMTGYVLRDQELVEKSRAAARRTTSSASCGRSTCCSRPMATTRKALLPALCTGAVPAVRQRHRTQ